MAEKPSSQSSDRKDGLWLTGVIGVFATLIIVGGVVYSWQKTTRTEEKLEKEMADLKTQIEELQPTNTPIPTPTSIVQLTPLATPDEYQGWQTYTNETFGYEVMHPANTQVRGQELDKMVAFDGSSVDNDYWPRLTISHPDSDFYHPPVGTDVTTWVTAQIPYDEIGAEFKVAGLPTVHLATNRSPQAYASDNYYFIKDNQLYQIGILHAGDKQDWNFYNKFLKSFKFLQ